MYLGVSGSYSAPEIDVVDVAVESGFALSLDSGGEGGNWDGLQ